MGQVEEEEKKIKNRGVALRLAARNEEEGGEMCVRVVRLLRVCRWKEKIEALMLAEQREKKLEKEKCLQEKLILCQL